MTDATTTAAPAAASSTAQPHAGNGDGIQTLAVVLALAGMLLMAVSLLLIEGDKKWDEARRVAELVRAEIVRKAAEHERRFNADRDAEIARLERRLEAMAPDPAPDSEYTLTAQALGAQRSKTYQPPALDLLVPRIEGSNAVALLGLDSRHELWFFYPGDFVVHSYTPAEGDKRHDAQGRYWFIEIGAARRGQPKDAEPSSETTPAPGGAPRKPETPAAWARLYADGSWAGPWPLDQLPKAVGEPETPGGSAPQRVPVRRP